ncbi:MAG: 8-oxo-dGTP diphosphatase MutT [Enterobacteriaceae bacterium]
MRNQDREKYRPIVIGIVADQQDQVLLTQRTSGQHLSGYWEFPGGKVNEGESLEAALKRELQEEVGIEVQACSLLTTTHHSYQDRHLALHFFLVTEWLGEAAACEGQPLRWVKRCSLDSKQFPPGNHEVIARLLTMS